MNQYDRVWAEIELDSIRSNLELIHAHLGEDTCIMGIIKADGYGHGALPVAKELEKLPYIYGYGVATAEEALMLKDNFIRKPIIIIGYSFPGSYEELLIRDVRITVFTRDMVDRIDEEARRLGILAKVHIKVDSGMGRIGIFPNETGLELVEYLLTKKNILAEGIFTHFASADEADKTSALRQYRIFTGFVENIGRSLNYKFPLVHVANSAAVLDLKDELEDKARRLVRCGIIMYGASPSSEVHMLAGLKPLLSLKSRIAYIKEVPEGTSVSYGGTYVTKSAARIATIPVGYGDGYPRSLSNKGQIIISGRKCPIIGRICMDQLMCDITGVDAHTGDVVTLIGSEGDESITLEDLSLWSGMLNYELACVIGKRVPRIYTRQGQPVMARDFFCDAPLKMLGEEAAWT